jgi:hypothetical protein
MLSDTLVESLASYNDLLKDVSAPLPSCPQFDVLRIARNLHFTREGGQKEVTVSNLPNIV